MIKNQTIEERIKYLESIGELDSNCKMCQEIFYPQHRKGNFNVFAPRHKAMSHCESGKRNHCTCDSCFLGAAR